MPQAVAVSFVQRKAAGVPADSLAAWLLEFMFERCWSCTCLGVLLVADVWKEAVWEFRAKSGSSGSCRLFLHFLRKIAVQGMSGKTPGSPRHPSSRHPRPSDRSSVSVCLHRGWNCLPFVRIHSGNNSKIVFLCICICYEIKIMSKIIFICYAAPSKLQRTAVSVSATKN